MANPVGAGNVPRRPEDRDERFRRAVESLPDAFFVYDADRRVTYANAAALAAAGRPLASLLGRRDDDIWPETLTRQWLPHLLEVYATGGTRRAELRLGLAGGRPAAVLATWVPILDAAGRVREVFALWSDMTERMRAEQALGESQRRWATAVESAGLGTWEIDLATKVSWRSAVHARIFGYDDPHPDWSLERFLAHVVPEEREAVRRGIEESLERREPWTVKCRIRRRDGAIRWVWVHGSHIETDIGGTPTRLFGLVQDVTDEEEVAAAVRDAERRHRQVLDVIPQLIWSCEPGGRCDYLSRQWAHYTGIPGEDQLGYGWLERLHPDDRAPTMEAWSRTVDTGGMFDTRFRIQGADGTYRWFRARAVPLRDASGDIVKWFGTNTDVDDQIRAEAALLEADRRKNEFLAVLSHELRNPLAPIKNSLYVLDHAADAERARQARAIIERQVSQLASLVDDLLDVTRITRNKIHLQRQRLELGAVVRRTIEDHRSMFEAREVSVEVEESAQPLFVFADGTRLAQVVGNLLQNAAKFTPAGGRTRVALAEEDGRATVRVSDTGIGMRPDTLERLFEPFVQADTELDRSQGGLGLGLALVKGLVELHGGRVSARSAGLGSGAEFVVVLPLDRDAHASAATPSPSAVLPRRVLVVEDNRDAASSLRDALQLAGHEVAVAADGREGVVKARTLQPDLVLCDIGLPEMDGYEVARAIRADPETAGLRLVALSGYALPEDVHRAIEAGFDAHLAKPPDLERVAELLAQATPVERS